MRPPILATLVALAGAMLGLWLTGARQAARLVVPFGAGVLTGVALFGLLPEMVAEIGWPVCLLLFAAGYLLLFAIDRYVYPVCPTCAHDHDHAACASALHGFAGPLVAATAVHSFFDGWSITTVQSMAPLGIRVALPVAICLHKFPEGVALGAMLWAAVRSRPAALLWCVAAEISTLAGGAVGLELAPYLGTAWTIYPIAVAGGCFFYLGLHAIHEEWRRRGAVPAFMPALTGVAGAAMLQQGVRALLR